MSFYLPASSDKQEELHKLHEQQQAALNQQAPVKPATTVSVRPQTYQTDPGTSISQRPVKTPLMPPGTAGNEDNFYVTSMKEKYGI